MIKKTSTTLIIDPKCIYSTKEPALPPDYPIKKYNSYYINGQPSLSPHYYSPKIWEFFDKLFDHIIVVFKPNNQASYQASVPFRDVIPENDPKIEILENVPNMPSEAVELYAKVLSDMGDPQYVFVCPFQNIAFKEFILTDRNRGRKNLGIFPGMTSGFVEEDLSKMREFVWGMTPELVEHSASQQASLSLVPVDPTPEALDFENEFWGQFGYGI